MEDDVDYSSMSDDELEQIASGDDVWSIGPALNELHERAPGRALPIAKKLLAGNDEWLPATALDIVFREDREAALGYMREHITTCGLPVLRVIVELLSIDDGAFDRSSVESLLIRVRDRLRNMKEADVESSNELFFKRYPDLRLS